jgi:hypothetical protein
LWIITQQQQRELITVAMADEEQRDVDMGENGDDGEDDSSSSDEEVEMDPADEKRIMNLEKQLGANPSVYDTHVQVH